MRFAANLVDMPLGPAVVVGVDGSGRTHRVGAVDPGQGCLLLHSGLSGAELDELLAQAAATGAAVVADDADRLPPAVLVALADAARSRCVVRISRRPVIGSPELAALDALVVDGGEVIELSAWDDAQVAAALAQLAGAPTDADHVARVREQSAGLPVFVAAHADADPDARIRARVAHQLAQAPEMASAQRLASLLALTDGTPVADDALARALGADRPVVARVLDELRLLGLLVPGTDRLVPAVARVLGEDLGPASRRELHRALGLALVDDGPAAAAQLRAGGVRTPEAAAAFVAEGERLRYTDAGRAAEWFDLAIATGAAPEAVAAGTAETAVLLGRAVAVDPSVTGRAAIAAGVAAAHQGRPGRAAELLLAAGGHGPALAVLPLVAVGDLARACAVDLSAAPTTVRLLAEGARALPDPARALPLLIEAAEAFEADPAALLPDTPHAVAALTAVVLGDLVTAEQVLDDACARSLGGPAADRRHRLLRAWVRLRADRADATRADLPGLLDAADPGPGRERLLAASLRSALARRSSEASGLREAWAHARPALARRTVDLLAAPTLEDLLVAAARMGESTLVDGAVADLEHVVAGLGATPEWSILLGWTQLQTAVATEDVDRAAAAAAALGTARTGAPYRRAQVAAAPVWADALAGRVAPEPVRAAAVGLAEVGAAWDASRLCGNAAVRTRDQAVSRALLEQARDLAGTPSKGDADVAGLSEREVEVARLVLAGETYKVIGARLFLSPKTVEHHVARIRAKVGAGTRAEMIARLKEHGI